MAVVVSNAYLLISSWINCLLYMLEIVLMVEYFQQSSRPLLHRIGVSSLFAFDTICTAAICTQVYAVLLEFPCQSNPVFVDITLRAIALILFSTYATASLEQLFLCTLYFSLTKNWMVTSFLVACVAVHFAFSYASGILILTTDSVVGQAILTSKVGSILCAITDVLVASSLLYTFVRMDITTAVRASTHSLLRRLIVLIFTSGVLVASTTLLSIVFLLKHVTLYQVFFFAQGRMYSLTILGNFLIGLPAPKATTINGPASAVTGVVFHVDYHTTTDDPRYSRRSELRDIDMEILSSQHTKQTQSE
ncbi:hypothetical protein C8R44DRAFT_864841 [Mycena epipterygia]|nr:hypothetical protein C8R44DRAFT_864841 [Mycena epipterygia]